MTLDCESVVGGGVDREETLIFQLLVIGSSNKAIAPSATRR